MVGYSSSADKLSCWLNDSTRRFDANTRAKISILGTDPQTNLRRLSEIIDPKDLPKAYGGQLNWEFGDLPNLDPEIINKFGVDPGTWPVGPIKQEGDSIVARGTTADGKARNIEIGRLRR
jgi:hypothetical protein